MDKIMAINSTVNGIVWGIPMLILIVGTGIYMTVKRTSSSSGTSAMQ